jgi:hypothetical protein
MSNNFGRKIFSKLSLKSTRSVPMISNNQNHPEKTGSSLLNMKSTAQESQQYLDSMHKIVDQTDNDLRRAVEHAAIRREQLNDLHFRSEEMLSKNENLVFGKRISFHQI